MINSSELKGEEEAGTGEVVGFVREGTCVSKDTPATSIYYGRSVRRERAEWRVLFVVDPELDG